VSPVKATRPAADCTANGPRRDDLAGSQIGLVATPECPHLQGQRLDASIRVDVAPTESGSKWRAILDGKVLCTSASPLITSARILVENGVDPNRIIEMWHQHGEAWALRGRLGRVAATLIDGEKATRPAKNRALARFPATSAVQLRREGV
jgi:hypothetical protein